jgi:5-(carboxyamino)imidazole ribonucleotide synthase
MNLDQNPASEIHQLGVIGGGQLAWMMLGAAQQLGIDLVLQTPLATDPAIHNSLQAGLNQAVNAILAPVADADATARLAQQCQVITFENEFVDLSALSLLEAQGVCFRPSLSVLASLLDKYEQRQFLQSLNLPVPPFAAITPQDDPQKLGFKFPLVIKSRRHGYDGQGTFILQSAIDLDLFWKRFEAEPKDINLRFMVEAFVPFERELAMMAARSVAGEVVLYPVIETQQQQQVCHWAIAPAHIPPSIQTQIEVIATTLLNKLDAVGIFGIELFLTPDGQVFVNEIAPRTHNSGHLTLEACHTSQFEQHLRAVCGLPLGDPSLQAAGAVMVNLLGFETTHSNYSEKRDRLAEIPNATIHWYSKAESKPGRKLGHVTVLLDRTDRELAVAIAQQLEALWYSNPT